MVIDDVHACLSTTLNQFTLIIAAPAAAYAKLLALFKEELHRQSEATALDIEQGYPNAIMQVPFWAWQGSLTKVVAILNEAKDTDEVKFVWPLIKEHLTLCTCVLAGGKVEISPRCVPISVIPSFVGASRRIFMTATLADDSILVTHFNANPDAVRKPISPTTASDVGDRMILVPQELNGTAEDDEVKALAKKVSDAHNADHDSPIARLRARILAARKDAHHGCDDPADVPRGLPKIRPGRGQQGCIPDARNCR